MKITKAYLRDLEYKVNGAAIEVHCELGPGLLESVYHKCLLFELKNRGIACQSELYIPIDYKGLKIDAELRLDILVEGVLPVDLKAVSDIHPVHEAQLMTYMKLLELPKGLLINFNVCNIIREGSKSYVNELYRDLL